MVAGFADLIESGTRAFTKEHASKVTLTDFDTSQLYIKDVTDAENITYSGVTTFNEFQYFTGLGYKNSTYLFNGNPVLEEITLPSN